MPLQLPVLDNRNFEQLLTEAKRRIPVYTPEWTNFEIDSDPGITIVQLFAFLTENLLYRADRIPERNRLKFLQLLGIPLQQAAPAQGLVRVRNERGPVEPLPLEAGIVVSAGQVNYITLDPVNVLPVEAAAYYKRKITDEVSYEEFNTKYQAVKVAMLAALEAEEGEGEDDDDDDDDARSVEGTDESAVQLDFYESTLMREPTAGEPDPVLDLSTEETSDHAVYLALLAPKNVTPEAAREALANQTISVGIVPALTDANVPALVPVQLGAKRLPVPALVYEVPDPTSTGTRYERLRVVQEPDVLSEVGVVQLELPGKEKLATWVFDEPMQEGTGDYPPRIEDDEVRARLVTWLRVRLPPSQPSATETPGTGTNTGNTPGASGTPGAPVATNQPAATTQGNQGAAVNARLTWLGVNAARVRQAIPIFNELLGTANGEPDQTYVLANTPVIEDSVLLEVQDIDGTWRLWLQTDDLLSAGGADEVFTVDYESGQVRFGDGHRGERPPSGSRVRASYQYGGGTQGNVAIGAVKTSPDVRLQGGFKIDNPIATWGGDTGETVEEGERNIPLHLRHRDRLVVKQDFIDITRRTPGVDVGRVEVLPLYNPDRRQENLAGVVTLMVVPATDTVRPLWPLPNRLFLKTVCDYLDERRLVTTEIYVRGPEYVSVALSVGVEVRAGYFRDQVIQSVRERLQEYLSSLPPGGPEESGWPLNKLLHEKDLEAVVTRVAGVEFVNSIELGVGSELGIEKKLLKGLQLPRLDTLDVREGEAESLESILGTGPDTTQEPTVVPVPVTRSKC
ncbi:MAG: putative baseplate assembly protein [Acidobacteria bacterium]|nr:putative baseplate assembly protein [Acidobacteriota bacterium]MCA1620636.1 putative baseplate assembly protein [Acidobacteriota bacterium]